MLLLFANLFYLLGAVPALLFALPKRPVRAENFVGVHLVTGTMALLQGAGLLAALAAGSFARIDAPWYLVLGLLPGYLLAMTALPILSVGQQRHAVLVTYLTLFAVVCGSVAVNGAVDEIPDWFALSGGVGTALVAGGGYVAAVGMWVQHLVYKARAARAHGAEIDAFQVRQAAFQAGEYAKLPANPELWQLLRYSRSLSPEVKQDCRARIAQRNNLIHELEAVLDGEGADQALDYLCEDCPFSYEPLAPAVRRLLDREHQHWQEVLGRGSPGSWTGNVLRILEVAIRVHRDGGDLGEPLQRWRALLGKHRELHGVLRELDRALAQPQRSRAGKSA